MSIYSTQEMYCTVCGCPYAWTCNSSFSKSRTCSRECHQEFNWRETLSIMGKAYYPRPVHWRHATGGKSACGQDDPEQYVSNDAMDGVTCEKCLAVFNDGSRVTPGIMRTA